MDRPSRRGANKAAKAEAAGLALKNLREKGLKRMDTVEDLEDNDVYTSMTEEEYAKFANERRKKYGGFVVGEEGDEYVDLGEEDDWTTAQAGASDEEDDAAAGDGKKRKKGGKSPDPKKAKPTKEDKKDRQRLANMFAKNAAAGAGGVKRKTVDGGAPLPTAVDADSLLEDILAGVGATDVPAAPPSSFRAVPRAPPVNQFRRSAPSQPPPSVAATPVTVMKPAATTPVAPRAAPTSVAKGVTWPENVEHVKKTADDEYFIPPPCRRPRLNGATTTRRCPTWTTTPWTRTTSLPPPAPPPPPRRSPRLPGSSSPPRNRPTFPRRQRAL